MTDSFDYATGTDRFVIVNGQTYRTGCRYVSTDRHTTPALARKAAEQVAAFYGVDVPVIAETRGGSWLVEQNNSDAFRFSGFDWSTLIYQAMSDRTRYAREG